MRNLMALVVLFLLLVSGGCGGGVPSEQDGRQKTSDEVALAKGRHAAVHDREF